MSVIFNNPSGTLMFGSLYYPQIEGEIQFPIISDLYSDLQNSGVVVGLDQQGPGTRFTNFIGIIVWKPFIRIISGLESAPFGTTPEARYKAGSWSTTCGYEVITFPNGTKQSIPYESHPSFLVYERNELPLLRCIIKATPTDVSDLPVIMDFLPSDSITATIAFFNPFLTFASSSINAYGINVNIPSGMIAEMNIQYQASYVYTEPNAGLELIYPVYG